MTRLRSILLGIFLLIVPASALALSDTVADDRASQFKVGPGSADEAFASTEATVYVTLALLALAAAAVLTSLSLAARTQTEAALDQVAKQLPTEEEP